jgi:hypothetical protein
MKKLEQFYSIGIGVLLMGIIALVLFKFVFVPQRQDTFRIEKIDTMPILDLDGNKLHLSDLLSKDTDTYFLIFNLNDCLGCIYKGLEELKNLDNAGKTCFGLVIDDYFQEVATWASHYEFSHFLVIKRVDFYEHIKSPITPVLVRFRNQEVDSWWYFTP